MMVLRRVRYAFLLRRRLSGDRARNCRRHEELYGPGYSGVSVVSNDMYVIDAKVKKETGFGSGAKKEKVRDEFEERLVLVRRVTKVVKGGKQLRFRAVGSGDKKGQVGVGVCKAKEVIAAVQKSSVNARRNIIKVPMTSTPLSPIGTFYILNLSDSLVVVTEYKSEVKSHIGWIETGKSHIG